MNEEGLFAEACLLRAAEPPAPGLVELVAQVGPVEAVVLGGARPEDGMNGKVLLARAFLSRVVEPLAPGLVELVVEVGSVESALFFRGRRAA